jgi:hypothetical protein
MRKLIGVIGVVAAAFGALVPALGLAGPPVVNDHGSFSDGPYATTFCGVPGTQIDTGMFHFLQDASGAFVGTETFSGLFTASATGKSLQLSSADTDRGALTDNGDGTGTFTERDSGLVLQFKIPNGPVLKDADGKPILGAGILNTVVTIDLASGDVLSAEQSWHGPHPLRDGVDICGPAIAYLLS